MTRMIKLKVVINHPRHTTPESLSPTMILNVMLLEVLHKHIYIYIWMEREIAWKSSKEKFLNPSRIVIIRRILLGIHLLVLIFPLSMYSMTQMIHNRDKHTFTFNDF